MRGWEGRGLALRLLLEIQRDHFISAHLAGANGHSRSPALFVIRLHGLALLTTNPSPSTPIARPVHPYVECFHLFLHTLRSTSSKAKLSAPPQEETAYTSIPQPRWGENYFAFLGAFDNTVIQPQKFQIIPPSRQPPGGVPESLAFPFHPCQLYIENRTFDSYREASYVRV